VSLYISSYISDTTSTSTAINWDPAYSKVDINRNETIRYIRHDPKRRFFNHVADNHGSFAQHDVLFQGNPYISGVATTKEYTEITTRNDCVDSDRFRIRQASGWSGGSFTTVSIYYNTSGTFTTSDASLSGIATRTHTVSGLSANTLYYFVNNARVDVGRRRGGKFGGFRIHPPEITETATSITGLTSADVSITGSYSHYTPNGTRRCLTCPTTRRRHFGFARSQT
jgi:hypothetical protein